MLSTGGKTLFAFRFHTRCLTFGRKFSNSVQLGSLSASFVKPSVSEIIHFEPGRLWIEFTLLGSLTHLM